MKNKKLFVAYFQTQQKAEDAIVKLKKNGYDIKKLSLIGTECYTEQSVLGFSRNKTITYKTEIKARKFMLCADETVSQIDKMRTLLHIHVPKENSITERENQVLLENQTYEL